MRKEILCILLIFLVSCSSMQKTNKSDKKPGKTDNEMYDFYSGTEIYDFYGEWEGTPYQMGGMDKRGIDCSGLSKMLYSEIYSINLPRTTKEQIKIGESIGNSGKNTGDLVFFRTGPNVLHVGVYLENDNFIHASTKKGVMISNLNEKYWVDNFIEIRRVLGEK